MNMDFWLPLIVVGAGGVILGMAVVGFMLFRRPRAPVTNNAAAAAAPPADDVAARLVALEAALDELKKKHDYELLTSVANDAAAYAEQQRHASLKDGRIKRWDRHQMRDSGVHYAREQLTAFSLTFKDDVLVRAVEAALGRRDRKPAADAGP